MPFARVAKTWVADDQSLPTNVTAPGTVRGVALDINFSALDVEKYVLCFGAVSNDSSRHTFLQVWLYLVRIRAFRRHRQHDT